jgi:cation:H+ antiporter
MTLAAVLWFAIGLVVLVAGAELLVRGASRLALTLGVSPLIVGLTIVAYGTSAPELSVSVKASLQGQPDLAVGNVVGSNIFNILVILGLSALVVPLKVDQRLVRQEVPLMIAVALLMLGMSADGSVRPWEGAVLFAGAVIYTCFLIVSARNEEPRIRREYAGGSVPEKLSPRSATVQLILIATGLLLLVTGSEWLLESSIAMARWLGVSELVIGLTLVAAGTSLPELATSVQAAIRGNREIAVGNVVGSNLFNVLCVLGLSASVSEGLPVRPSAITFDIPVMIGASLACLPIFFSRGQISRWEGILLLGGYAVYLFCVRYYFG